MRQIKLSGGPPWGFRIYGDAFVGVPFRVSKVEEDSVSWRQGLSEGEWVLAIDGVDCTRLTTTQARHILRNCQGQMCLTTVPREEGPPIPSNSSATFQSPNKCSPNLLPYKNELSVGDQQDSGSTSSASNCIDRTTIDSRSVRKLDPPSCSRVQQPQSSIGTCESSAALSQDTSSKFGFKRESHNGLFLKQLDQIYANSVSDNSNIKSKHSNVPEREESQRPPTSASDWSETSHPPVSTTSEIDGSRLSASVTPEISVLTVDSVSPDSWPVRELNSVSPVYPDLVERVPPRGGRVESGGSNKPCVTPDLIEQAPPGEGREGSSKHCVTPESVEPAATGGAANKPCNFSPLSVSEADSTQLEQFEMLVKNLTAETGLSTMTSPTSTDRPNTSNSDDRRSPASPYFRGTPSPGPYLPQPYISSHSSPNGCDIWRSSHSVTSSGHPRSGAQIRVSKDQPDSETPPLITAQVWAPAGSPQIERKQFRPVRFDSHSLTRENKAGSRRLNSAPLTKYQPLSVSADRLASFTSNRLTSLSGSTDSVTRFEGASSRLPRTQDTTVTLLQQARNARNSGVGGDRARVLPVAQVDGVGPTTSTGMPVALRSTVKSESKSDWYKKVYENLHKQPEDKYDQAPSEEDTNYSRSSLRELQRYRGQPGRIENYLPGKSSITSDQNSTNKKASSKSDSFTKAILSEDKLDSYVYNRNEATTLTPGEKKNYYSHIQRGGDIPACGLQKPAPERTKNFGEDFCDPETVEFLECPYNLYQNSSTAVSMATMSSSDTFYEALALSTSSSQLDISTEKFPCNRNRCVRSRSLSERRPYVGVIRSASDRRDRFLQQLQKGTVNHGTIPEVRNFIEHNSIANRQSVTNNPFLLEDRFKSLSEANLATDTAVVVKNASEESKKQNGNNGDGGRENVRVTSTSHPRESSKNITNKTSSMKTSSTPKPSSTLNSKPKRPRTSPLSEEERWLREKCWNNPKLRDKFKQESQRRFSTPSKPTKATITKTNSSLSLNTDIKKKNIGSSLARQKSASSMLSSRSQQIKRAELAKSQITRSVEKISTPSGNIDNDQAKYTPPKRNLVAKNIPKPQKTKSNGSGMVLTSNKSAVVHNPSEEDNLRVNTEYKGELNNNEQKESHFEDHKSDDSESELNTSSNMCDALDSARSSTDSNSRHNVSHITSASEETGYVSSDSRGSPNVPPVPPKNNSVERPTTLQSQAEQRSDKIVDHSLSYTDSIPSQPRGNRQAIRLIKSHTSPNLLKRQINPDDTMKNISLSSELNELRVELLSPDVDFESTAFQAGISQLLRLSRKSQHFQKLKPHYQSLQRLTDTQSSPQECVLEKVHLLLEMLRVYERYDAAVKQHQCSRQPSWRGDVTLRCRGRSVEDLRRMFNGIPRSIHSRTDGICSAPNSSSPRMCYSVDVTDLKELGENTKTFLHVRDLNKPAVDSFKWETNENYETWKHQKEYISCEPPMIPPRNDVSPTYSIPNQVQKPPRTHEAHMTGVDGYRSLPSRSSRHRRKFGDPSEENGKLHRTLSSFGEDRGSKEIQRKPLPTPRHITDGPEQTALNGRARSTANFSSGIVQNISTQRRALSRLVASGFSSIRKKIKPRPRTINLFDSIKKETSVKSLGSNGDTFASSVKNHATVPRIRTVGHVTHCNERFISTPSEMLPPLSASSPDLSHRSATVRLRSRVQSPPPVPPPPLQDTDDLEKSVSKLNSYEHNVRVDPIFRTETSPRNDDFSRPERSRGRTKIRGVSEPRAVGGVQQMDWSIHRPIGRYVPDSGGGRCGVTTLPRPPPRRQNLTAHESAPFHYPVPTPRIGGRTSSCSRCCTLRNHPNDLYVSPSRYQESNVNIHYRSPVRWEEKEPLSEVELNRRQAETMRRIYRETEARKQQKMVEDRLSRRHGDNLLPSQKSPIPLNRYDAVAGDDVDSVMGGSIPLFATVMHDFQAQSGRELGVSQGDTVRIRRQVDDNWYEAQRGTRVGIIPCSYVQINDPKRRPANREQLERVRARYDFKAQTKKELNLFKGDVVTVLRRIDENWLEGRSTEKIGIFPSSYVQPLENDVLDFTPSKVVTKPVGSPAAHGLIRAPDIGGSTGKNSPTVIEGSTSSTIAMNGNHRDEPAIKQLSPHLTYRAMYPYMKQNDDEMELREGDIITVVEQCADGWYVGTNQRSGVFGTFPGNFTHRL